MKIPYYLSTEEKRLSGEYLCTAELADISLVKSQIRTFVSDRVLSHRLSSVTHKGQFRWVVVLDATEKKPPDIPQPDDRMICEEPALPWEG